MTSSKKLKRFHKDIYFPDWSKDSLERYMYDIMARNPLTFSFHSLIKVVDYSFEYGKNFRKFLLRSIKRTSLNTGQIFEFYSSGEKVSKACFRMSFEKFPMDIVLVISADGVVITIYVINKGDSHTTLDKSLYERSS